MPFESGVRLGPYEIVAPLGAGGMGEVYRARDTRLDRTVAVKVLPPQLAADPELRERFEREARAISSLNHPHICALFDVGRDNDVDFLVLEFLEGHTLADRLTKGALPVDEAVRIAIQICDALDKAHHAGIVHRDLKPANVMLTKSGAKLLDFGLAKAAAPVVTTSGLSMLPTTPPNLTAQGAILGTFQYMAPEQIEGLDADTRTDVFAFGALLFEMIAGRPPFEGKTRASLLGAILKDAPPPLHVAPQLNRIISTCLEKDPDDRYQSARDLLRDLRWAAEAKSTANAVVASQAPRARVAAALLLLTIGTAAGVWVASRSRPVTGMEPIQFTVAPPDNQTFGGASSGGTGDATQLALSPDGRHLAFVARDGDRQRLWIRSASSVTPRALAGAEDATFPFWSPDSRQVAFFAAGKLKKIAVAGGPPVVLCDAPSGRGGTWSRDNVILFASSGTDGLIHRVSAAGGVPNAASKFDAAYGENYHRFPSFLPDGRHFLFTAAVGACCPPTKAAQIRIGALDTNETSTLFQVESSVQYASGHLFFVRNGTLMAQPFDASALKLTGDAFPVAEQVGSEGSRYGSFSVSDNGVLAYGPGATFSTLQLTWRDRSGRTIATVGEPAQYMDVSLSPDDRHIAVTLPSASGDDRDIWIVDSQRGTTSRLTFDPGLDVQAVWSPDGTRIAYESTRDGRPVIRLKNAAGTSTSEVLVQGDALLYQPSDWSRDGRFLLYRQSVPGTSSDVWVQPLFGDRKPFAFVRTEATEYGAVFSPDGRWVAYQSNETSTTEVYVQPFPPTGAKYQVSRNGGSQPEWRHDGKELFFRAPQGLMAVPVDGAATQFEAGIPHVLFATNMVGSITGRAYAVANNGERFLVVSSADRSVVKPITVLVNWLSAIQK
ncbi:MAG TPA: protein kinase [Vicinamibacterales bacterium]|nr:protein kinase [Vicinamibacterales bacterium]